MGEMHQDTVFYCGTFIVRTIIVVIVSCPLEHRVPRYGVAKDVVRPCRLARHRRDS